MTILALLLLAVTPVFAYEQDDDLAALEGLVSSTYQRAESERMRIESYLIRQKVKRPEMYSRIICQEIADQDLRRLFAVKLVRETRGDAAAVSPRGAVGPWQVMQSWVRQFKVKHPKEPRTNLRLALKVYKIHLADANGKTWGRRGAVWRYSGGSDDYVAWARRQVTLV
jgi:hypothetical protein